MTKTNAVKKGKQASKKSGGLGGRMEGNTNQPVDTSIPRGNQVKHWFFTWNNHTEENIKQLLESLETHCFRWRFEEEIGESGTPHLQGVCSVKKEKGIRWSEFKLPNTIHWEKVINVESASKYCNKDFISSGARKWEFGYPKQLRVLRELRSWQHQLKTMLEEDPDDRSIIVIYDPVGGMGKTQFLKYFLSSHNGCFTTGGEYKDIACTINLAFSNSRMDINDTWTFFMSLPRDQDMRHVSYRVLEGIKDGILSSNKYESSGMIFNNPHVVMMTNQLPIKERFGVETMTADKWRVYTINEHMEMVIYNEWYN